MHSTEVEDWLGQVHDWRQHLWPIASKPPKGPAARQASRARQALRDAEQALHDMRRILYALEQHPAGSRVPVPREITG